MNDQYRIDPNKPVWFTSFFSGYDSGLIALREMGVNVEFANCCEWAYPSILAAKAIHYPNESDDLYANVKTDLAGFLSDLGISADWEKPMTKEQIVRKGEAWAKTMLDAIAVTANSVDITKTKGLTLVCTPREFYTWIATWSYPCQSISLAGPQEGMAPGSGTRSSLAFEVIRILKEIKMMQNPPDVLLMENVPLVHSVGNAPYFEMLQKELEGLGYRNYWADLDAKDYGSPQSRRRCFMVSVLNDGRPFAFPEPSGRMAHPADVLLEDVPPQYYLIPPDLNVKSLFTPAQAAMIDEDGNVKRYAEGDDRVDHFGIGQFADISFPKGYNKGPRVHDFCPTLNTTTTQTSFIVKTAKGIRKLTPLEAWRIQGVGEADFRRVEAVVPDAHTLFHLAGDSIDVAALKAIFGALLPIEKAKGLLYNESGKEEKQ